MPEFVGLRRRYELTGAIESLCDHGTVVEALRAALKILNRRAYNTGKIDLFLSSPHGLITHLFEVKTDKTTGSLYQAVGQAMLHGALENSDPQRILVLPGELKADAFSRLKMLGIRVLRYDWKKENPVFSNLVGVVR